jgi:Spy/CpxP family protein refolding chaperone
MASTGVVGALGTQVKKRPLSREVIVGLALLVVVGAGIAIGIAIDRLIVFQHYRAAWTMEPPSSGTRAGVARQLARDLDLSPQQQVQVDSIIARQMTAYDSLRRAYQPRVRALMVATRAAIDSILTPTQRERLRALSRARDQT